VNVIDQSRTKTQSPQTNGICERFHKTILNEFYQVAFRKKIYGTLEELQADLDAWLVTYNRERTVILPLSVGLRSRTTRPWPAAVSV
jgi:transposase InsO family protein